MFFEPVGELGEDRPSPRLSQPHHVFVGELAAQLLPFILDLAFDSVERADEGQASTARGSLGSASTKYLLVCIQQPKFRMLLWTAL